MYPSYVAHFLLFALAIHYGESVKCYTCSSLEEPKCADPFTSDSGLQPVECTSNLVKQATNAFNSFTKKLSEFGSSLGFDSKAPVIESEFVCSKIDTEVENKKVTVRGCAPSPKNLDVCKFYTEKNNNKELAFCGTCETDLCNGASPVHAVMFVILPALALLLASS